MFKILLIIYRWIFARRKLQKINRALFHLSLRGLGILNYENDKVSGEWYLVHKVLPALINSKRPIFFDVGANIGNFSDLLLSHFPSATIYAFEPHPKNFSALKGNRSSSNLKNYNLALGDARGELILYDRTDHEGSEHASLYEAVISEIHKKDSVGLTVSVDTLDEFSKNEKVTFIDFMKVDTEGNELAVLRGASNLLENSGIGCIHFEFNEMNVVSRVFFRDFRKLLHNYDLYRLLPNDLLPLNDAPILTELFAFQNIIALPKNFNK
jgi:FkbM family methyltransferase